jgi:hypothetical protein
MALPKSAILWDVTLCSLIYKFIDVTKECNASIFRVVE